MWTLSIILQGEKKRVGLSAALLKQPDVLLLDEPTNHLDIDALEWLADFLKPGGKDKDMAMLLVTHDRFFLEKVCSESKFLCNQFTFIVKSAIIALLSSPLCDIFDRCVTFISYFLLICIVYFLSPLPSLWLRYSTSVIFSYCCIYYLKSVSTTFLP